MVPGAISSLLFQHQTSSLFNNIATVILARCDTWLRKSLKLLGIGKLDLWLMHWPGPGRHLNYPPVKMGMERPKQVPDRTGPRCQQGVIGGSSGEA